jgi:hypothetical protein
LRAMITLMNLLHRPKSAVFRPKNTVFEVTCLRQF